MDCYRPTFVRGLLVGLDRLSDAKERALGEAGGQLTRALDQPPPSFVRGKAGSGSRGRQTAPPLRSLSSPRVAPGGLSKKEKPRRYARGKYKEARVPDGRTPVQENTAALCAGKRVVIKDAGPKERALAVVPIPTERSAAGNTRSAMQSAPRGTGA
jgi:hypothetical protein